ncbi:MAG: hypothetical protein ACI8QZ_000750 [Chlamydiales bacterium]|jgi:hypothetical protein
MLSGMPDTTAGRGATLGLVGFAVICLASLIWPGFPLAADAAPARLWGIPFPLVWSVGWILAALVVVAAYHLASGGEEQA